MNDDFFGILKKKIQCYFKEGDGHNFDHVQRVYDVAIKISDGENVDMDVVKAAALLHDIARFKEDKKKICHADEGSKMAREILEEMDFPKEKIDDVVHAIFVHRYSKGLKAESREAEILQDADRLDALGALIITRVFEKCGKSKISVYEPDRPLLDFYDGSSTTGINHLYEKSLKIKPESFKTSKARELAKGRYNFVKEFVDRFKKEWRGEL